VFLKPLATTIGQLICTQTVDSGRWADRKNGFRYLEVQSSTRRSDWKLLVEERSGQAAVSRCGSFQPGRGKWQV